MKHILNAPSLSFDKQHLVLVLRHVNLVHCVETCVLILIFFCAYWFIIDIPTLFSNIRWDFSTELNSIKFHFFFFSWFTECICAEEHFHAVRNMSVSVRTTYARVCRRTLSVASLGCCRMMLLDNLFRRMCWSTLVYLLRKCIAYHSITGI